MLYTNHAVETNKNNLAAELLQRASIGKHLKWELFININSLSN